MSAVGRKMTENLYAQDSLRARLRQLITLATMCGGGLAAVIVSFALMGTDVAADSEPKRIVLIGATALAAPDLINQALDADHEVSS